MCWRPGLCQASMGCQGRGTLEEADPRIERILESQIMDSGRGLRIDRIFKMWAVE